MASASESLTVFLWEGVDRRGSKIKGEAPAKSPALVRANLRKQGIVAKKVRKKPKPLFGSSKRKVTPSDIAVFSRQIATMLKAGVPLVQSFDIIGGGHDNPSMRELITGIKTEIEGGSSLSEALGKHPAEFDELYVNLVKAGESAGVLDDLLDTIAEYKERIESLKGKIKKALFYPIAVIVVAVVVSVILLVFVVPQFETMFRNFGADLPAFTQMMVGLSHNLSDYWYVYFGAVFGAVYFLRQAYRRSRKFVHFVDRASLKIPVVGGVLNEGAIARFSRTLATTFSAGVPLVEALDTVAGACGNIVYADAVLRIKEDIAVGHQLQLAMQQTDLFPHMVVQMTAIGEEAGSLDTMLNKVADFYEERVNNTVDALSSLLEPMIMVVIGVMVGSILIAMYLPIFKLGSVVG